MLPDSDFNKIRDDVNRARDAILLKKAKSEEMRQEAENIAQQLIQAGIATRQELENNLDEIIERYEKELSEYHKKVVSLL